MLTNPSRTLGGPDRRGCKGTTLPAKATPVGLTLTKTPMEHQTGVHGLVSAIQGWIHAFVASVRSLT